MASFLEAVTLLLKQEGGLEKDEEDAGGITNRGISFRFYKSIYPHAVEADIINLSEAEAITLYKAHFWDNTRFQFLDNQIIVNAIFDAAVNMGIAASVKILQRAYNAVRGVPNALLDDGVLGQKTLDAVNLMFDSAIQIAIRCERAGCYRMLVVNNPSQIKFLNGWLARAYSL